MKDIERPLFDNYDDIRKEQDLMKQRLSECVEVFQNTKSGKDEILKLLSSFIKCTGDEITVCRTQDNSRILVTPQGIGVCRYRHKSPDYVRKINDILDILKENWLDFNAVKDDEVIKRIECFLIAVKRLPQLSDAYKRFSNVKQVLSIKKKIKVLGDEYSDYKMQEKTLQKIAFQSRGLRFEYGDGDYEELNPLKLGNWYVLEQVKEVIFESFDRLESDIKESLQDMKKAISDIKKDLAPILMLEGTI